MSASLGLALVAAAALTGLNLWLGRRSPWLLVATAAAAVAAACLSLTLVLSQGPVPDRLLAEGNGSLVLGRLAVGVLAGCLGALLLWLLVGRQSEPAGASALALWLAVPAAAVLGVTALVPLAAGVAALAGSVWLRWQRVGGPQLPVRSLGRQTLVGFASLMAAAALLPSVRAGSAPSLLEALLLAAGVTALMGVLPFAGWPGGALRLGPAESKVWWIWMAPVGVVLGARLVAEAPPTVGRPLQTLLLALGVASALFWSARGTLAPDASRYWRVLAADAGFMAAGVGLGSTEGLGAALLLVMAHWLGGPLLSTSSRGRSRILGWIGISGLPPFGGFSGRFLVVISASQVNFGGAALLLLAMGLQLAAAAAALPDSFRDLRTVPLHQELGGLLAAAGILALGLVPGTAVGWLAGIRL